MARGMLIAFKRGLVWSPTVLSGERPRDHPAPSRCTPQQGCFRARLLYAVSVFFFCSFRSTSRTVESMVVTASSDEHPTSRSPSVTSPTLHSSDESAKRSSVCIALLLLIRDLFVERGAVTRNASWRFWRKPGPSARSGVPPLQHSMTYFSASHRCRVAAANPTVENGLIVSGFLFLPETQTQWLNFTPWFHRCHLGGRFA